MIVILFALLSFLYYYTKKGKKEKKRKKWNRRKREINNQLVFTLQYSHNFINILRFIRPMVGQMPGQQPAAFDNAKLYMWVKGLETKVNNLLREVNVLKNDFMKKQSDIKTEVKALNEEIIDQKREQERFQQKMDMIIKELKRTAGIEEVMTLKKYIELWNPMNFVTQRDLDRVIESKIITLRQKTRKKKKVYKKPKRHK